MHSIRRLLPSGLALALALALTVPAAHAFLDELTQLKMQLQAAQVSSEEVMIDFPALITKLEAAGAQRYTDVLHDDWFSQYVGFATSWGIVSGYKNTDGTPLGVFHPANPVTVAEALKMTLESAGVNETRCLRPPVHSQAASHWAALYVSCAEELALRLFQGPEIDLNRPIHRGELLTLVHDAFGDTVLPLFSQFTDTEGNRYEADIAYGAARGIVSGDEDIDGVPTGSFRPEANINRAEVAKILFERLSLSAKESRR